LTVVYYMCSITTVNGRGHEVASLEKPMTKRGFTALQLEILKVLWDHGPSTVAEVHRTVGVKRGLASATIATLLRRLEAKGAVTHSVRGRQFVFEAVVTPDTVRRSTLAEFAEKLLPGDVPALINYLFAARRIGADELDEVKRLIEQKAREARK
jgi:BlaI family transcriptional regulator, penicillinase repressor